MVSTVIAILIMCMKNFAHCPLATKIIALFSVMAYTLMHLLIVRNKTGQCCFYSLFVITYTLTCQGNLILHCYSRLE